MVYYDNCICENNKNSYFTLGKITTLKNQDKFYQVWKRQHFWISLIWVKRLRVQNWIFDNFINIFFLQITNLSLKNQSKKKAKSKFFWKIGQNFGFWLQHELILFFSTTVFTWKKIFYLEKLGYISWNPRTNQHFWTFLKMVKILKFGL